MSISRIDLSTGRRTLVRTVAPADRGALNPNWYYATITPDGRSYAFTAFYYPADLYLVSGLH